MTARRQRLRLTFAKGAAIRFSSHLDVSRLWVRSLRRARAPLIYSQGYNPRPKIQIADALPLGYTASRELIDVWLGGEMAPQALAERLAPALPRGIVVGKIDEAALGEPALQTRVASADYKVHVEWDEPGEAVEHRTTELLGADAVAAVRKNKPYNLRPLIDALAVGASGRGWVVLEMRLAAQPGRTARPEAVLDALGMAQAYARFHRRQLVLSPAP